MFPNSISSLLSPGLRHTGTLRNQEEAALIQEEHPPFAHVNQNQQVLLGPEAPWWEGEGGASQPCRTPCPTGLQQLELGPRCFGKLMSFGSPNGEGNLSAGLSRADAESPCHSMREKEGRKTVGGTGRGREGREAPPRRGSSVPGAAQRTTEELG